MNVPRCFARLWPALALVAFSGCLSFKPVTDPTRFYVLTAPAHEEPLPDAARLTNLVFVAAVETPAYLDDLRIAVRRDEHRLDYSDLHQWGEPVREGVRRGLRNSLAALLGSERVYSLGRRRPAGDVIEVQVGVSRFEVTSGQRARLVADWRLVRAPGGEILAARHTDEQRPYRSQPPDFSPAVAALSDTLASLSHEIASTAVALSAGQPAARQRAAIGTVPDPSPKNHERPRL